MIIRDYCIISKKTIVSLIAIRLFHLLFLYYIKIIRIIGIIAIIFYTPTYTLKWYTASDSGFNSSTAFVYIRGSYRSKNIAISRWLVLQYCTSVLAGTPKKQAFSTVFDPPQLHERDATEQHIWPNVYLVDALPREPIRIVRARPEQTVAWPKHGDASCSHGTFRPASSRAAIP